MLDLAMKVETLTSPEVMVLLAVAMAVVWGIILETSKAVLCNSLKKVHWWSRAVQPQTQMMHNFGFPKVPTKQFPNAVSEPMARELYAYTLTLCAQHFLSALTMIPVVYYGWDEVSEHTRSLFVLGTLSDLGFDIYDSVMISIRTFQKNHANPLPFDFWVVIVALHHSLALSFALPMNWKYIHLPAYQQTIMSLLMAASICYVAGSYKFTLDVKRASGLYQYKAIVLLQLITTLYTRVYMWFPAILSIISHFKTEGDAPFWYGGVVMGFIFSVFNMVLVADGIKAAVKWLPCSLPKSDVDVEDLPWASHSDAPVPADVVELVSAVRRRCSVVNPKEMQKIQSKTL